MRKDSRIKKKRTQTHKKRKSFIGIRRKAVNDVNKEKIDNYLND